MTPRGRISEGSVQEGAAGSHPTGNGSGRRRGVASRREVPRKALRGRIPGGNLQEGAAGAERTGLPQSRQNGSKMGTLRLTLGARLPY